jgi:hypothetical protein
MKHLIIIAYGCRSKCPAAATAPDETDDAHGAAWARAFLTVQPGMPILWLRAPDGRHPATPLRESMQ